MKRQSPKSYHRVVIAGVIVLLAVVGLWVFKSFMVSPQVALIDSGSSACKSNVDLFTMSGSCGAGMVRRVDYACVKSDQKGYEEAPVGGCIDPLVAYARAKTFCGETCDLGPTTEPVPSTTPQSSIMPSLTPTPTPSTNPSLFSCTIKVFKLKSTDVIADPMTFTTTDRKVDPAQNRANPGDRYAYLVEAVANNGSTNVATISASTKNVHGFDEPILVQSTTPYCRQEGSVAKYLSCTHPSIGMNVGENKLLKLGMVVQIQNEITRTYNTSTNFHVNFLVDGRYHPADCAVTMLAGESTSTPTPTPTPTSTPTPTPTSTPNPTTPPGCYYEKPFCLSKWVGGVCSSRLVCPPRPSPSVTPRYSPTPRPTVRPTYRPTPTPTPIRPVRCYNLFGRQFCFPVSRRY